MPALYALLLALLLALSKTLKPNPLIHNFSEILMYSGIAVLLVPMLNLFWISGLLVLISIYDYIAVYKSKHMVSMAKFQSETNLFAGISLHYKPKDGQTVVPSGKPMKEMPKTEVKRVKHAILGGGDIAFPLIFSGVVMNWLIEAAQITKLSALLHTYVITLMVTLALSWLFYKSEKDKFYPAMPIVSLGCFIGLAFFTGLYILSIVSTHDK